MSINPADAFPLQSSFRYKSKDFSVIRDQNTGKTPEEQPFAIRQTTENQFSENKRMQQHRIFIQKLTQGTGGRNAGKVFSPD
jgi:hypothetical protein